MSAQNHVEQDEPKPAVPPIDDTGTRSLPYASSLEAAPGTLSVADLATVLLKLFALYQLLLALPLMVYAPMAILAGGYTGASELLTLVIPTALPLVFGVLLLIFARWLSVLLFGRLGERRMRLGPPGRRLQAVAFAVAGAVLFVDGIAKFVQSIVNELYNRGEANIDDGYGRWDYVAEIGGAAAVQIVAGLWLFFGAKALARFWHRVRTQPNPMRPTAVERTSADD